jgi:hypothetical protein
MYHSVIIDSITQAKLQNVRVYVDKDTVGMINRSDGTFQVNVTEGSIIRFRKTGYRWLNMEITDNSAKIIKMIPSTRSTLHDQFEEVEVNGKLLPKEEWDDLNPNYFINVAVSTTDNNKNKLVITTK